MHFGWFLCRFLCRFLALQLFLQYFPVALLGLLNYYCIIIIICYFDDIFPFLWKKCSHSFRIMIAIPKCNNLKMHSFMVSMLEVIFVFVLSFAHHHYRLRYWDAAILDQIHQDQNDHCEQRINFQHSKQFLTMFVRSFMKFVDFISIFCVLLLLIIILIIIALRLPFSHFRSNLLMDNHREIATV